MSVTQQRFGKYRLQRRIAVGGMAEVFLATVHGEAGFEKPVVIKRLHPHHSEDDTFVRMFIDEARITAQLSHRNICQVLDLGAVGGEYFMTMEYVAGEDLRSLQDHARRVSVEIPPEAAVYIACEVLSGLDFAHRKEGPEGPLGIVHRDISPQNVLISYEGEVKVTDFGIAKVKSRLARTEAGIIKGKFRYMSPEQASARDVDARTDLFAAAVVLYELLLGEPHSMDLPETEVLHRMRTAAFEPIRTLRPAVGRELDRVLGRALARKPGARFQSASELRGALLGTLDARQSRFGAPELAGLMRLVFDERRRRARGGSVVGAAGPATGAGAADEIVVVLSGSELLELPDETGAHRAEAATSSLRPALADATGLETFVRLSEADLLVAGERGRAGAGAFSRAASAVPGGGRKDAPRELGVPPRPAPVTATARPAEAPPGRRGSSLRTLGGLLVVLLAGGGLATALLLWDTDLMLGRRPAVARAPDSGPLPRLMVSSRPEGAKVLLCDKPTGRVTPLELPLAELGRCDIELRLAGHDPYRLPATVHGGRPGTLVAALRPATRVPLRRPPGRAAPPPTPAPRPGPPRATGTLRVTSIQAGTVLVNNRPAGRTPSLVLSLRPGTYDVKVFFPSLQAHSHTKTVTVKAGGSVAVHAEPPAL